MKVVQVTGVGRKLEYAFYTAVVAVGMWTALSFGKDLSDKYAPPYSNKRGITKGWLPWTARKMDLKDAQYREFRGQLGLLVSVAIGSVLAGKVVQRCSSLRTTVSAEDARKVWLLLFTVVFIGVLHGGSALHLGWIVAVNYGLSWLCSLKDVGAYAVGATWVFSCLMVLCNTWYQGYEWYAFRSTPLVGPLLWWADDYTGMTQWRMRFPLVILRMISFNMDRYWAANAERAAVANGDRGAIAAASGFKSAESRMQRMHQPLRYYESYAWYISYLLYPPLYIAGPTMTYNSFIACNRGKGVSLSAKETAVYILRAAFCFLVFEVFCHYIYVSAMAKDGFYSTLHVTKYDNPLGCAVFSLLAVLYLYLKFLCIWRFFRAWALLDGVYPPENMPQCIIMTTSVADFWKGWHSSYNKWCVRYMYIPLGGNMSGGRQKKAIPASATGIKAVEGTGGGGGTKITSINIPASSCTTVVRTLRRVINIALIFTFVAVWHDQEMNLLAWGWLMLLCMIPELVAGHVVSLPKFKSFREGPYYRHARAAGSVVAIFQLILANVVGFSTGLSGGQGLYTNMFVTERQLKGVATAAFFYFCLAQLSHAIRDHQRNKQLV